MFDKQTLLTTADVAVKLNVSVKTVTRWAASGVLVPAQRLTGPRGAFLFDPEAVELLRGDREVSAAAAREPWEAS